MNLTAITIVALVSWAVVSIIKTLTNKTSNRKNTKELEQLEGDVKALKERVATLEKIITDEASQLRREIDALDD